MKKSLLSVLTAIALLGFAQTTRANSVFRVDINTAALNGAIASQSGPFYLDFAMSDGTGANANTVTLSGFTFTGGSATGSLTDLLGGTSNFSGSVGSTVSITASTAHPESEIAQGFTAGTTDISFLVNVTGNLSGTTPAGFFVSIDDSTTFQIPTTAPDGISLLVDDFGGSNPKDNGLFTYSSSGVSPAGHDTSGVTVATPESGPGLWMLAALTGAVTLVRRSRKA